MTNEPKIGDILNNGHYDIKIESDPWFDDDSERWFAEGRRWVPSRKGWSERMTFGWKQVHEPKHVKVA